MPNQFVFRPPFRKRGQSPFFLSTQLLKADVTGAGGVVIGGTADVAFVHGAQVASDIVVEWDLDNDGDFSDPLEDITSYVLVAETKTGRDWPSQLTGLASPGQLSMSLLNDDNRFSYFNTASPLNQGDFSLRTGRKIRVRTATATSPDPLPLAKDRFRRSDGALGTAESGQTWSEPFASDFTLSGQKATATSVGNAHAAVLDTGSADYYVQANLSEIGGRGNIVGLIYRYQDSTNYSLAIVDVSDSTIKLRNVVAGTPATVVSETADLHDDMTIGVLVEGAVVTFYLEGVPVMTGTAIQTDETEVGIYASWVTNDLAPQINSFYVWDGLPAEVEGILWTGDVADLSAAVDAGSVKVATVQGKGWLGRMSSQKINTSNSATGRPTGVAVGEAMAQALLLHPPGQIDEGDITTGPYGIPEKSALDVARDFEEAEFGFLYESQEGYVNYDARSARAARTSQALFSDVDGAQFGYSAVAPLDWRRELVNRCDAGVAPAAPSGVTRTAYTQNAITGINIYDPAEGAYAPFAVTMPGTVTAGDLLLVVAAVAGAFPGGGDPGDYGDTWVTPAGWVELSRGLPSANPALMNGVRVFAKVADGTEDSTSVAFFTTSAPGLGATHRSGAAHIYRATSWFGSVQSGVVVGDFAIGSDPAVIFPSWGPAPSLIVTSRVGTLSAIGTPTVSGTIYPLGYTDGTSSTAQTTSSVTLQSAYRTAAVEVENPGAFSGTFSGFDTIQTLNVAVRGFNGSPPQTSGVATVRAEDTDSQDTHNAILTHRNASNLFADDSDAGTYAQLVIDTYSDDRPILALTFYPVKSGGYRSQAIRRRVGDKITVVAENNAGLGINADFFIEAIRHKWSRGVTLWETTWELSPDM